MFYSADLVPCGKRDEQPSSSAAVALEDESKCVLGVDAVAEEAAAGYGLLSKHRFHVEETNSTSGDAGGENVLGRADDVPDDQRNTPGRTLPAWGQKKLTESMTQVPAPQVGARIEADATEVKPVVLQTNLSKLTDSWAMARPAYQGKTAHELTDV
jgi:hypothetical protein